MTRRPFWRALAALALAIVVAPVAAHAQGRGRDEPIRLGAPPVLRDVLRNSVYGNVLAARTAANARDMASASVFWRAALRQDPRNAEILERAFVTTLANGDMDDAMPLAERLIQVDRAHRMARLALATRAIKARQFQTARGHLLAAPGAQRDLTTALIVGWTHLGSGSTDEGVAVIDRLTGADWYQLFKNYHSGLILDVANRRPDAGRRLEAAYRQDATILRIVDAWGRWNSRNRSIDDARAIYAAYDKVIPNHPIATEQVARLAENRPIQPFVRNAQQGAAEVLYGLGAALSRQGGEDLALIYLQLARYLDERHELAAMSLADLFEFLRLPSRAIETYEDIPETSVLHRNAVMQKAVNLDSLDRADEARQALVALLATRPNDVEALQTLGNLQRVRKLFAEAAQTYTRALDAIGRPERQHWVYFYFRGIAHERLGRWAEAESDFKRALELIPEGNTRGRAQVLNYLGYSWVDQGVNLEEGLRMVKQAVELTPEDGHIVDSLGWAYYRLGRYEEAVVELERAIELQPGDPVINDHLGDAYWKVGRRIEAVFQWNHARDLKPEPDDLPRILDKIEHGLRDSPVQRARTTGQAPTQQSQSRPN